MASFHAGRLTDQLAIDEIVSEWNDLAVVCNAQPFALPALGLTWHRHLGRGNLAVITVRNGGGRLEGLVAVDERRKGLVEVLEPLGQDLGAVTDMLIRPGSEAVGDALWQELLADERRSMYITDFMVGRPGLSSLRHGEHPWHATLSDECPCIDLRGLASASDHLADSSRSGLRKHLRKAERALGDRSWDTIFESDPEMIEDALDRVRPLYDRSHDAAPKLHLDRGPYRPFFREAMHRLAAQGQVTIARAELDGEPVAFDIYVVAGGTASAILGRFDPRHAAVSPGQLLTRAGIDWAIATGLDRIDLQLGASLYKRRWATSSYDTVRVLAAHPSNIGRARRGLLLLDGAKAAAEVARSGASALRSHTGRAAARLR